MEDQQEGNEVYHSSEDHDGAEENDALNEQQVQSRINDDESCRNEITECSEEIVDTGGETIAVNGHHGVIRLCVYNYLLICEKDYILKLFASVAEQDSKL